MLRVLAVLFAAGALVSCASHQATKFEPYQHQRPGYQAPEVYERLARKDVGKTFKAYRDADFDHRATEVVRYKGEDIWKRRVRVTLSRSEMGDVGARDYPRTDLILEYSPSGQVLSATRKHDAGLKGAFTEVNFAFEQDSKSTDGQSSKTEKPRVSPKSTSRLKREFLPEVETDYPFPSLPFVR